MLNSLWLQALTGARLRHASKKLRQPISQHLRKNRRFLPRLERFEDRTLPSTFTVLYPNDSGAGSLRAAIALANAHAGPDTISFSSGVHGTIPLSSGELLITDSVTINGPGAKKVSVSGKDASRIFDIAPGQKVAINDLTLCHGYALDQGGGILNEGSDLSLSSDVLSNNVAVEGDTSGARGGAIRSLGGVLTVSGCQFIANQALGTADLSAEGNAFGGGIYVLDGSSIICNTTFTNNQADGGDNSDDGVGFGGAVFTVVDSTVINCTFGDNVARGGSNTPGSVGVGGALYNLGSTTIAGSCFSENRAIGGNGGVGVDVGLAQGGAVNNYGTIAISHTAFEGNLAIGGNNGDSGPGIDSPFVNYALGGGVASPSSSVNINYCSFKFNDAVGGNNSTATTDDDIVGVGGAEGGALYLQVGATGVVANSSFLANEAVGGSGNNGTGGVALVGEGLGGAIAAGYGGDVFGQNTLTVSNCSMSANTALGGDHNSGYATVSGLFGAGVGGGLANYAGGTVSITGSSLVSNQASGGKANSASGVDAVFAGLGAGGGIFNYLGSFESALYGELIGGVITVTDSVIVANKAVGVGNGVGGGIANLVSATTSLTRTLVTLNEADGLNGANGFGGGAYNDDTSSLELAKCLVTFNRAAGAVGIGGGIDNLGSLSYDGLTFIIFNLASTSGNNIGS